MFLEGFKVTTLMDCVVIWFDYLVDYPVVFWGLDVALGDGIPLSSSLRFGDELAEACGGDEARPS